MIDKKQLQEIIQDLLEVVGEKDLIMKRIGDGGITFDSIFQEACSYQRGFIANQNRSQQNKTIGVGGSNPLSQEAKGSVDKNADVKFKPSYKQLKILREAGYKDNIINQMSKKEISIAIGDYLKNLKRENI